MTFYDWLIEKTPNSDNTNWAVFLLATWGWIEFPFYWLPHRGLCLLLGCNIKSFRSDYLPDDCLEWYCKRCDAEGINWQGHDRIANGLIQYLLVWYWQIKNHILRKIK